MKNNKYHAIREGNFPSKLESAVYEMLLWRERAKEIKNIKRQHCVKMTLADISWKIDFSFEDNKTGEICFVEAKGIETSDYRIKKRLWAYYGLGVLEIWKGSYKSIYLEETIVTKKEGK